MDASSFAKSMFGIKESSANAKPIGYKVGDFLRQTFNFIMSIALPKGQKRSIQSTGENPTSVRESIARSKQVQFGASSERLPDGRHRFFKKDGVYVDRLATNKQ